MPAVTFQNINYFIRIFADLNSIVDYSNNTWGINTLNISNTDISNVQFNLPSGTLSLKMGQVNVVPSGDPNDIKGNYDVIVTIDASSNGTMSSIVTLSGDDITITVNENSMLKQQLYWSYNDLPQGDADILSITSNKDLTTTFHSSYLNNLADEFTGTLIKSWNGVIDEVIRSSSNIIVDIANHNNSNDQNIFVNGDTIFGDQSANYELYITDYNGISQEIVPPTGIYFVVTHDDNGITL